MAVGKTGKTLQGQLKLQIPAGGANPSPPVGPALGQRGINIMEFCKAFNEATAKEEKGVPLPVIIYCYQDKSFDFVIKTPPASWLLLRAAGIKKGAQLPGRETCGQVSMSQCREIAERKLKDLNTTDLDAGALIIAGSARSMGLELKE